MKQIRTGFSLHGASELTVFVGDKILYGILVHSENSTSKEIREMIEKEGGWLVRTNGDRPLRVVKEVNPEILEEMINYSRIESAKIFSSGTVNLGFILDCGKSVLRMLQNYFCYSYGEFNE